MEIKEQNNIITIKNNTDTINLINHMIINDELISSVVILIDMNGMILFVSNNNININFKPNEKISEFFNKKDYKEFRKIILESLFTNKITYNDLRFKNRIFKIVITPLSVSIDCKNLLITFYDITKSKKMSDEFSTIEYKLNECNSIKSIFLSNISHELRTPMNAIIGFSNILLDSNLNNKSQIENYLKSINSNANYLDKLLNNILDTSKIESGEFDILYENFSIFDLFDELQDLFDDLNFKENSNNVDLVFIKNDDMKIISDYLRLKQVLFNIISNSIKFTEKGYIKISFSCDSNNIIFKIEDTGIGISNNNIKYVFDRFWQADSSSTKKYKGTGLGLSVSKDIIHMLNGKIWLNSTYNKGTTFFIKLPLDKPNNDKKSECDLFIDYSNKTILIIDELPVKFSLLGIYLKSMNFNILEALNGKDAINIYKEKKDIIDIVFIDITLYDINSLKIAKCIKNINNNCKIVLKSGSQIRKNKLYDYYLLKPINKNELILILNNIFNNKI